MISKESLEILKELAETQDCSIHWNSEYNIALDEAIRELEDIKEKSADEMFEELGYIKLESNYAVRYRKPIFEEIGHNINFYKEDKMIAPYGKITMQELKAINKKIEELGW